MKNMPTSSTSDGTAANPSIRRQLPDDASIALMMNAARMPPTIISWLSEVIAPRTSAGAISAR
jgi:hypothetical protein